jgi:hypothetical protein
LKNFVKLIVTLLAGAGLAAGAHATPTYTISGTSTAGNVVDGQVDFTLGPTS